MPIPKIGPAMVLCLSLATNVLATPGQDVVTASLQAQGFEVSLVHWTLLGRIRIIAVNADIRREIVINPTTGEILRDYSQRIVAANAPQQYRDSHSDTTATRATDPAIASDLDASAVMALENIQMGAAPLILTDEGQN